MNELQIIVAPNEENLQKACKLLKRNTVFSDAVKIAQVLTDYSKKMLSVHELNKVLDCMHLIGKVYDRGGKAVKSAIESVYIFSFSSMQSVCNKIEWNIIRAKMPVSLYALYTKQLYSRGI